MVWSVSVVFFRPSNHDNTNKKCVVRKYGSRHHHHHDDSIMKYSMYVQYDHMIALQYRTVALLYDTYRYRTSISIHQGELFDEPFSLYILMCMVNEIDTQLKYTVRRYGYVVRTGTVYCIDCRLRKTRNQKK